MRNIDDEEAYRPGMIGSCLADTNTIGVWMTSACRLTNASFFPVSDALAANIAADLTINASWNNKNTWKGHFLHRILLSTDYSSQPPEDRSTVLSSSLAVRFECGLDRERGSRIVLK